MTRLGYCNDSHLRSTRPSCRLDEQFYEKQLEKLDELVKIFTDEKIDEMQHGGDLFHVFNPVLSMVHAAAGILSKASYPVYVNPGNHDIDSANISTLYRSALGVLEAAGVIHIGACQSKDFNILSFPYALNVPESAYTMTRVEGKVNTILTHDMLTTRDYLNAEKLPLFPHKNIFKLETNADLVLCSHWHSQFLEKTNGTAFVNSGPLDTQTINERHVKPGVVIIDAEKGKLQEIRIVLLKTTGYEKVEVPQLSESLPETGLADSFVEELKNSGLADGADLEQVIRAAGTKKGYMDTVIELAINRVVSARTQCGVK